MDEGDSGFIKFKQTSDDVVSLAPSTADSIFLEGMEASVFFSTFRLSKKLHTVYLGMYLPLLMVIKDIVGI